LNAKSSLKPDSQQQRQHPARSPSAGLWQVYVWTISYLKPYRLLLSALIVLMIVVSTAELLIPKFIQFFIDTIVPGQGWPQFYTVLAMMALIVCIVIGANMAQNLLRRHIQEKAARDLQLAIFRHLRKLGFSYYERNPVGQTLSFLNTEVTAVQNLYRQGFPWLIEGIVFSVVALVMMATTSWQLSLIIVPSFLLYYIWGPSLERKASISGKTMSQNRIAENQKVYESISALTELRAFASERWDLERYLHKVETFNQSMIRTYWYAYLRGTNRRLTYNAGGIAILICGYFLLQAQSLSVGQFASFLLYYFMSMHRLTAVVTNITEQKVLMYQAERLHQFMNEKPQVEEQPDPVELSSVRGAVAFHNVSFRYNTERLVLDGLNLMIAPGGRTALVGTSGNGKSTTLKLIGRFYDPHSGSITLDGIPIRQLSFASLRQHIGYVFQETYLFGSTVRDNIRFGSPDATEEQVIEAAIAAHAHDFIAQLPNGYDTLVGERGIKLSGGQKQRIAIARMLIKNPAIILLDEATSALDRESEMEVQKALDTLLVGRTVIAVAHRLSTIKDFDQIAVIDDGKVVELGTYDALLAAKGAFYELAEGAKEQEAEKQHA